MKKTLLLLAIATLLSCEKSNDSFNVTIIESHNWIIQDIAPVDNNILFEFTPTDEIYQFSGWKVWQTAIYYGKSYTREVGTYSESNVILWQDEYEYIQISADNLVFKNEDAYIYFIPVE